MQSVPRPAPGSSPWPSAAVLGPASLAESAFVSAPPPGKGEREKVIPIPPPAGRAATGTLSQLPWGLLAAGHQATCRATLGPPFPHRPGQGPCQGHKPCPLLLHPLERSLSTQAWMKGLDSPLNTRGWLIQCSQDRTPPILVPHTRQPYAKPLALHSPWSPLLQECAHSGPLRLPAPAGVPAAGFIQGHKVAVHAARPTGCPGSALPPTPPLASSSRPKAHSPQRQLSQERSPHARGAAPLHTRQVSGLQKPERSGLVKHYPGRHRVAFYKQESWGCPKWVNPEATARSRKPAQQGKEPPSPPQCFLQLEARRLFIANCLLLMPLRGIGGLARINRVAQRRQGQRVLTAGVCSWMEGF